MKTIKQIFKYISITLVIVCGAVLFMLSRQIAGYRAFVVMSSSMEPTITTGSLIITRYVNPHTLGLNDIVTFIRPDKTREFITHRIVSASKPDTIPLFSTKGDNNESPDTWTLVGGGIVGKVVYTIPHLGYLLSIARTKIGIAILILLPAVFIIVDEIIGIYRVIRNRNTHSSTGISVVALTVFTVGIASYSIYVPSHALVSDTVLLDQNVFSISETIPTPSPTITPTTTVAPSPSCSPGPEPIIEGNGAGSVNTIILHETCRQVIEQSQDSSSSTTVVVTTNTGGITVSNGDQSSSSSSLFQ